MSDKKSVTIIFVADGTWGNDDGVSEFRDSEVKNFCFFMRSMLCTVL